jgi:hypothetical protein
MDLDKVMLQEHKQSLLWLKTLKERRSRVCVLQEHMNTVKPDFKMLLQF